MTEISHTGRVRQVPSERTHPSHHHGKIMHLTLNRSFVEDVQDVGVDAYLRTLVEVAARQQLTVTETIEALRRGWARDDIVVDDVEIERLAEQMADPGRVGLIVEDEDGRRLIGTEFELAASVFDEGYHEPGDPHRPFYS